MQALLVIQPSIAQGTSALTGPAQPEAASTPASAAQASASDVPQTAGKSAQTLNPDKVFDKERFDREVTKSKDLPNFHEVHPFLYRGGAPTLEGLQHLKAKGISVDIDLRGGDKSKQEAQWAKQAGLKYINLPMSSEPPTKQQVDTFLKTVKRAEADPKKGSVFVHCAHGSDRAGCMVGIWRVTQDGWNYPQAYSEMRHYWFTPKFTKLSGAVERYAHDSTARKSSTASSPTAN